MAKKSKLKKHIKRRYSKHEFMDIVCLQTCRLCPKGSDPKFCYDELHKNDKGTFFKKVLPKLIAAKRDWVDYLGASNVSECDDSVIEEVFRGCFCAADICGEQTGENCDYLAGCMLAFRGSMGLGEVQPEPLTEGKQGKKSKKEKKKFIPERYATFFCSSGFKEDEFRKIINGNNPEEQDTCGRCSRSFEKADF